ncbi:MAG: OmpA family protein [Saprospiraceae bacterium]|nr:OmpA family protein [Saprospiraceae bacterium]
MNSKWIFSFIALTISLMALHAQPATGNTPDALVRSGDEQIEKGQYYRALEQYEKAYKEFKERDIAVKIAKAHLLLRDYNKASIWFGRVLSRDRANKYNAYRFDYGVALKMNEAYTEAAEEFKKYLETGSDDALKKQAQIELEGIELRAQLKENVGIEVKNAGKNINTPESQNGPAIDREGILYFGSLDAKDEKKSKKDDKKKDDKKKSGKEGEDEPAKEDAPGSEDDPAAFMKIYNASFSEGKGWQKAEILPELINRNGYHSANVSFSKDGQTMFFTRAVSEGGFMEESKIYASSKTATTWSPAIEVKGVNGDFLARHPVEGELYGSRVLFFSANIPGGKGGFDLYYANKIGEAEYSAPVNIAGLNTEADEWSPYMQEGTLYFSTNGLPGIGGFDVFQSKWTGSDWTKPENMGMPVNSSVDDLFYKLSPSGDRAVIVSNRAHPDSKSLKSKTCCDDIYFIEKRKLVIDLTTIVLDEKKKGIKGATAQLIEMKTGKDGEIQSKSNSQGNEISHLLDKDRSYKVVVSKDGFFPAEFELNTVGIEKDQSIKKEVVLRVLPPESDVEIVTINEPIRLNSIYYDFDDDKILPDAEKDLAYLKELMDKYSDMVIELSSHTDSRGIDDYNEKLSQRRANSAKKWLMTKKVSAQRIVAKGYGEEKILNHCNNGEECTEEEHRFNRRTEFKILSGPTTIEVRKEVMNKKGKGK